MSAGKLRRKSGKIPRMDDGKTPRSTAESGTSCCCGEAPPGYSCDGPLGCDEHTRVVMTFDGWLGDLDGSYSLTGHSITAGFTIGQSIDPDDGDATFRCLWSYVAFGDFGTDGLGHAYNYFQIVIQEGLFGRWAITAQLLSLSGTTVVAEDMILSFNISGWAYSDGFSGNCHGFEGGGMTATWV